MRRARRARIARARERREARAAAAAAARAEEEAAQEQAEPEQANDCAPGYDPCVPPYPPDVDCPDLSGPITVSGENPHGLDGDDDGVGCEGEAPGMATDRVARLLTSWERADLARMLEGARLDVWTEPDELAVVGLGDLLAQHYERDCGCLTLRADLFEI